MKLNTKTYELNDVTIVQAPIAYTTHRGDVDNQVTICDRKVYPIFAAPMGAVIDENNYKTFIKNGITPVIPRTVGQRLSFEERMELAKETFVSISLREAIYDARDYFENHQDKYYICIDIAHGTLNELYTNCQILKHINPNIELMAGNVANPDAYAFYAAAGISWMRVNIGSGHRCTSSANVGIHYGTATLLDKLNEARKAYAHSHNGEAPTKLICDGGIANFDDINKAIALGADSVMIGKLFAECEEACGEIFEKDGQRCREYYGMSTRRAQRETGGEGNRTSEGISKPVEVKYPLAKWVDNMQSYLRSCMTYTNSRTIEELQKNAQLVICSDQQFRK